jgi:hypothetical protein
MSRLIRWTGLDLGPLPYESLVNVLQRFAWSNALDAPLMRQCFTRNGAGRRMDIQRFAYASFGQAVLDMYQTEKIGINSTWYCKRFRFCPICLQELYHSSVFQYAQLMKCPLHDVPLVSACQSCGAQTPLIRSGELLFKRPYECDECGATCAGAPADISGHLQLRANVAMLAGRLTPIANWWASGAGQRRKIDLMARAKDHQYYASHHIHDLLQSLRRPTAAEPPDVRVNVNDWPRASRICWRQRMEGGRFGAGVSGAAMTRRHYEENMYAQALRILLQRIAQKLRIKELYLVVELERFNYASSEHMAVELLALGLMRLQLEGGRAIEDTRMLRPFHMAQPSPHNWPYLETWFGNAPRVAFYSAYIGLFAAWYHNVRRLGWAGAWRLFRQTPPPTAMVLMRNQLWCRRGDEWFNCEIDYADEVWFDGEAAAVAIPGLPLFPYRSRVMKPVSAPWLVENLSPA